MTLPALGAFLKHAKCIHAALESHPWLSKVSKRPPNPGNSGRALFVLICLCAISNTKGEDENLSSSSAVVNQPFNCSISIRQKSQEF